MRITKSGRRALLPVFILIACMLTACIPAGSTHVNIGPDLSEPDTIELDFVELHNDTIDNFGDIINSPYVFVTDINIEGSNAKETISVTASLVDDADESDAEHFAAAVLRHMGEAAANQYPTLSAGDSDEFGGIFDLYSVSFLMSDQDGEEIYTLSVPAGEDIPLDPDIERYEEEWLDYLQLYYAGQEDDYQAWLDAVDDVDQE